MTDMEIELIADVLREGLADDDSCRTQVGLLLYRFMKQQRAGLRNTIRDMHVRENSYDGRE
jgi:hypothetical protein